MSEAISKRQKQDLLKAQLDQERQSFMSHWRDLGEYILPRRPRFVVSDVNKGDRRNQKIIDSTGTMAARTCRSGMMSGITSPARPWFRLSHPDPEMNENANVKNWLHAVSQRMATVFLRSNLYNVLPVVYGDMSVFGTSAMMVEEDFDQTVRFYPFPIGSYFIANNERLQVDVFMRDFRMTVRQLVNKFGQRKPNGDIIWDNFSNHVKSLWDTKNTEAWIDVTHAIYPNPDHNPDQLQSKFKKYLSCYYESGGTASGGGNYMSIEQDKYLRESGYDYFPVLCPRWEVNGEDVYGTDCPGMVAIGDIKQLQLGEKRLMQAIEKMVNPPMVGSPALRNQKASILPGDITYDPGGERMGFRPAHEVEPKVQDLEYKQDQVRGRIKRAFFEDVFMMISSDERNERATAMEISVRKEEKLIALGPVLEQLNQDLLDKLIDITFMIMIRQGQIPEAPDELQGVDLKVEYLSIMAQAQKLVGIAAVDRFFMAVSQVAQLTGRAPEKADLDQYLDVYAEMTSVPPSLVRSDEDVAAMRQAERQQVQQQQQAEMLASAAASAKDMSQTDMESDNALTRLTAIG